MDENPLESAKEEQERLDGAFERARTKLAAARSPDEQARKTISWLSRPSLVLGVFGYLVCVGGGLALIAAFAPEQMNPSIWRAEPLFPVLLAGAFLWALLAVWRVRAQRRWSPERRVIEGFYDAASEENPVNLSQFVIQADLDGAPRRPPSLVRDVQRPALFDGITLNRYWKDLLKPERKWRYLVKIEDVVLSELEPDLKLASVKLRLTKFRRLSSDLWLFAFVPLMVVADDIKAQGWWWFWGAIGVVLLGWIASVFIVNRKNQVYRVRKLLVRCGEQWRLFCADWEGYEERDLSWLDNPAPKS